MLTTNSTLVVNSMVTVNSTATANGTAPVNSMVVQANHKYRQMKQQYPATNTTSINLPGPAASLFLLSCFSILHSDLWSKRLPTCIQQRKTSDLCEMQDFLLNIHAAYSGESIQFRHVCYTTPCSGRKSKLEFTVHAMKPRPPTKTVLAFS